jgi:hypothetical protein
MKKMYETPAAKLTGLAATEELANVFDFDELLSLKTGPGTAIDPSGEDINIPE